MTRIFCTVLVVLSASVCLARELSIAAGGKSDYVIVIREDATAAEKLAAAEVAKYIKRMSGGNLEIRRSDRGPADRSIAIAQSKEGTVENGIAVIPTGGSIIISGDSPATTLNAAYTFLDLLGCRFLAPQYAHYNGSAEVIPKRDALVLNLDAPLKREPQLKFRKLYVEEGHSHDIDNLKQLVEWMAKVGYNTLVVPTDYGGRGRVRWDNWREELTPQLEKRGILIEVGGHGYQNFLGADMEDGRLFERHPEWFAKDESGKPQKAQSWVFCTSNEAARKYLIDNFLAYVKDRPEIDIFDFWPPDGAKWCQCDECKKFGEPPDRQAILLRQVKQAVKPVRPDLRLEVIAYSSYLHPPAKEKVDEDVLVDFCPINQQFDGQINDAAFEKNKGYVDALVAWREQFTGDISIYSYYRKYAWDSLPVLIPRYMQKDLQFYATLPVQGVSVYCEPGDWFTYELNHYVLAHLAWDSDADVDALITKFCDARYGGESAHAQGVLATLEEIVRNHCSVPHTSLKSADEIAASQPRMQEVVAGLAAAQERATDPSIKRNLKRLELMCTYALRDLEIQHMRATNQPRDAIRAKATELHARISEHADDGVFLIKNNRLNLARMLTRYGVGDRK